MNFRIRAFAMLNWQGFLYTYRTFKEKSIFYKRKTVKIINKPSQEKE